MIVPCTKALRYQRKEKKADICTVQQLKVSCLGILNYSFSGFLFHVSLGTLCFRGVLSYFKEILRCSGFFG